MNKDIEKIFEKNGFLSDICYHGVKKPDLYETVIEYRRFKDCESSLFKEYVENHFIFKRNTPQLAAVGMKGMRIQLGLVSA